MLNKPTRHTHGYFLIYMKRDIFTPKWEKKLIKRNIGFKADTLEMACLLISIQQLPSFATKSFLLEKPTYKIIMIKITIY